MSNQGPPKDSHSKKEESEESEGLRPEETNRILEAMRNTFFDPEQVISDLELEENELEEFLEPRGKNSPEHSEPES